MDIWNKMSYLILLKNLIFSFIHSAICLEVFGYSIAEALAMKKYVIATQCEGTEMQIKTRKQGLLIKPNSVNEMISAIESSVNNYRNGRI